MHAPRFRFPLPDPKPQPQPIPHPSAPPVPETGSRLPLPMIYTPAQWEYKHLQRPLAELERFDDEKLRGLGADGWELVGVTTHGTLAHFFFKRLADR
jgi:hypothetical protein